MPGKFLFEYFNLQNYFESVFENDILWFQKPVKPAKPALDADLTVAENPANVPAVVPNARNKSYTKQHYIMNIFALLMLCIKYK